jgi:phosphoglycolate phosphatase-like HAD superfamily hydrolase
MFSRRLLLGFCGTGVIAGLLIASLVPHMAVAQTDPLPSWNEGPTKTAIIDFVGKVTAEGGRDFVPPEKRIAVFDNDGTLWAEQPVYFQFAFVIDDIKRRAQNHPEWQDREPYKSAITGNTQALAAMGHKGVLELLAVTNAGMTTEEFSQTVADWFRTARHPKLQRPYNELVYVPQLELLGFLRAKGFKTFIVSGGGIEFMRVFADQAYGIPSEQVVGSSGMLEFVMQENGKTELLKLPKVEFIDDGPGKPVAISRFIGHRPIFAFGNSDGDQQMLEYVASGDGACFMALLHHTDAEREWAYDRQSHIGKLDKAWDEALARGWTIVDMKADWKSVFPPAQ